jgi:hypothetical protein
MMDMTSLFFKQNNDVVVTAKFPDFTSGAGITTEFWYKDNKYASDSDPSSRSYTGTVLTQGTDGLWFSNFTIPAADNAVTGAFWWRVDATDATNKRRTAQCGTLLVEAV